MKPIGSCQTAYERGLQSAKIDKCDNPYIYRRAQLAESGWWQKGHTEGMKMRATNIEKAKWRLGHEN